MLVFVVRTVATVLDPILLIGFVVSGFLSRRYSIAVLLAVGYALAIVLGLGTILARQEYDPTPNPLPAVIGGAGVAALTVWLRSLFRARPGWTVEPSADS